MTTPAVIQTQISSLPLLHRGKVRDVYGVGDDHLLIIATDRVSAFDVILPTAIPGKGKLLTQIALFWFEKLAAVIGNHLAPKLQLEDVLPLAEERAQATGRSMLTKRLQGLPIEAVVRGYLIGSGWQDYQTTGQVCGHSLPSGLRLAEKLERPLFTPATKATVGEHDENIDFAATVASIGQEHAKLIRRISLALYQQAAVYARSRGIIIADTKFEFGLDKNGELLLMDEVLTPDSSRFWPADQWQAGQNPPSYDKQFIRDYLNNLEDWNREPPGPSLPKPIVEASLQRYREALQRLTS